MFAKGIAVMTGLESADTASLTLIERRWDPRTKIQAAIFVMVFAVSVWAPISNPRAFQSLNNLLAIPSMWAICTLWYLLNMHPLWAYRIGWDRSHIYMRDSGWRRRPFLAMRMADVIKITTGYVENAAAKARFFPFDFIELQSSTRSEPISITPALLYQVQLKDLLRDLYAQSPDIFPNDVVDYMQSGSEL